MNTITAIQRLIFAVRVKTDDDDVLVTLELTLNEVTGNCKNCVETQMKTSWLLRD